MRMRFVTYKGLSFFGPRAMRQRAVRSLFWIWNPANAKPWYHDMRVDKHVFWVFSWVVWAGFMERFGGTLALKVGAFHAKLGALGAFVLDLAVTLAPNMPSGLGSTLPSSLATSFAPFRNSWGLNPEKDLDLTVNTDCEDLAAFANDVFEFIEQDRSLLLDSLTDFGAAAAVALGALGTHRVLSSRLFKRRK